LCVLLLRGPQTPGELRTRCERLYAFEDLDAVHAALNLLMRREPPMAKVLPGSRAQRNHATCICFAATPCRRFSRGVERSGSGPG